MPVPAPSHPALQAGRVAVVTGAANGIGRAVAEACSRNGMKVVLADVKADKLNAVVSEFLSSGICKDKNNLLAVPTDVSKHEDMKNLREKTYSTFQRCDFALFNAGVTTGFAGAQSPLTMDIERWRRTIEINLWGTLYGVHEFVPAMLKQEQSYPGIIAATSSRQGLTLNPGDTAYVISKVGQRAVMESLEHELRNLPDHKLRGVLLCPGRTVTDVTAATLEADGSAEKAAANRKDLAAAWGPNAMPAEHPVEVLFEAIDNGKFYGVCTDHYKTKAACLGEVKQSADDVLLNRPPLSRWHPDFEPAFLSEYSEAKPANLKPIKRQRQQ
eukprot:TRINITY_DN19832_c0_g1_i1.p1 TRINITY_DN19832_c0_g1~~TRINITY_DN19832_c0_g1_i1.p1  ORF type:complete len:328 (-),score=44.25 TRINITY_DN19832_c0_g1_i1:128-1111(-)